MDYAKATNILVIGVQHTSLSGDTFIKNTNEWEIHPKVLEKSFDYIIEKNKPSSFHETNLEEILKKENVTEVII